MQLWLHLFAVSYLKPLTVQYAGWERTAVRSQPAYCTVKGFEYET